MESTSGIRIELERCVGCAGHQYCTKHQEEKYDKYEKALRLGLQAVSDGSFEFLVNPGPKSHGMNCRRTQHNDFMWTTMAMDQNTRRWYPETTFRYPRIGAFEVYVCNGKKREEVFSKLKKTRWPNTQWLCSEINDLVHRSFGSWTAEPEEVKEPLRRQYTGIDGKQKVTDEELRQLLKGKFSTIVAAFRAFDKNGDRMINKKEFIAGLRNVGVDVPREMFERLWRLADEDNSGNIHYTEFAKRFCVHKASHSLHRHANLRDGEETVLNLHGVGAASRLQRHAAARQEEDVHWDIGADAHNPEADASPQDVQPRTIPQLSRCAWLKSMPIEEMSVDQIRARIYGKHGNLLNAFRHFDLSGDSRISHDEFLRALPKALGESISAAKSAAIWKAMDKDGTGEIDIQEFASDQFACATQMGAKLMKGLTVDVLQGERPSHHKYTEGGSVAPSPEKPRRDMSSTEVHQPDPEAMMEVHQPNLEKEVHEPILETELEHDKSSKPMLERPASASTIASVRERPLQRPQSAKSVASVADSKTSLDEYSDSGFEASSTAF
jgi:Ca2+-binding EF-hand superfamily protein